MTTDTPFWSDGRIWMDTAHRGARAEASGSRILPIFASSRRPQLWRSSESRRTATAALGGEALEVRQSCKLRGMHPLQQKISLAPTGPRDAWQSPYPSFFLSSRFLQAHWRFANKNLALRRFVNSFVAETPVVAGQPACRLRSSSCARATIRASSSASTSSADDG